MTVPVQDPVTAHTGNGVTTNFAYDFLLLDAADLLVYVNSTLKSINTDYTLTGIGNPSGGEVVFASAPANASALLFQRSVVLERQTDYQYAGDFQSSTVNRDFDRLVMAHQDTRVFAGRALRLPLSETTTAPLPPVATRALRALGFDASGNPVAIAGAGDASSLALLLQDDSSAINGAALVGFDASLTYPAGSVGQAAKTAVQFPNDVANSADAAKGSAIVGYKMAAAGAVGRTLSDKLAEFVSVKDFGAKGDGVTDDTAAFQAAYAASKNILIPRGSYVISGRVGSLVDGAGPSFIGQGANLSELILMAGGGLDVSGRGWRISELKFTAGAVVTCAIKTGEVDSNENSELSNCFFVSNSHVSDGVNQKYFQICADIYRMWYSNIRGNVFRNGFYHDRMAGVGLKFHYSVNVTVTGNSFAAFDRAYEWTTDQYEGTYQCEGHMIIGNGFVSNQWHMYFGAGLLPTIEGNILDQGPLDGYPIESYANCTQIVGNWIASAYPVLIKNSDRHIVANNVFDQLTGTMGAPNVALVIDNADFGNIHGNVFRGYYVAMSANAGCGFWTITGNNAVGQTSGVAWNFSNLTDSVFDNNVCNNQQQTLAASLSRDTYVVSTVPTFGSSATEQPFDVPLPVNRFPAVPVAVVTPDSAGDLVCSVDYTNSTTSNIRVVARKRDGSSFSGGYRFFVQVHAA